MKQLSLALFFLCLGSHLATAELVETRVIPTEIPLVKVTAICKLEHRKERREVDDQVLKGMLDRGESPLAIARVKIKGQILPIEYYASNRSDIEAELATKYGKDIHIVPADVVSAGTWSTMDMVKLRSCSIERSGTEVNLLVLKSLYSNVTNKNICKEIARNESLVMVRSTENKEKLEKLDKLGELTVNIEEVVPKEKAEPGQLYFVAHVSGGGKELGLVNFTLGPDCGIKLALGEGEFLQ